MVLERGESPLKFKGGKMRAVNTINEVTFNLKLIQFDNIDLCNDEYKKLLQNLKEFV